MILKNIFRLAAIYTWALAFKHSINRHRYACHFKKKHFENISINLSLFTYNEYVYGN